MGKQKEVERDESVEVRRIEDDITELLEMGFNRREARQCYRDAGKNLQQLILALLDIHKTETIFFLLICYCANYDMALFPYDIWSLIFISKVRSCSLSG